MFSFEFCQIFKNTFFYRKPPVATSSGKVEKVPWFRFRVTVLKFSEERDMESKFFDIYYKINTKVI